MSTNVKQRCSSSDWWAHLAGEARLVESLVRRNELGVTQQRHGQLGCYGDLGKHSRRRERLFMTSICFGPCYDFIHIHISQYSHILLVPPVFPSICVLISSSSLLSLPVLFCPSLTCVQLFHLCSSVFWLSSLVCFTCKPSSVWARPWTLHLIQHAGISAAVTASPFVFYWVNCPN